VSWLFPNAVWSQLQQGDHLKVCLHRLNEIIGNGKFQPVNLDWKAKNCCSQKRCGSKTSCSFPVNPPARSAVGTSGLALSARTEIECLVYVDSKQAGTSN